MELSKEHKKALIQYELKRNGVLIYTGTEENCYFKLQREQSQSADYALKYGGWTINPKNK